MLILQKGSDFARAAVKFSLQAMIFSRNQWKLPYTAAGRGVVSPLVCCRRGDIAAAIARERRREAKWRLQLAHLGGCPTGNRAKRSPKAAKLMKGAVFCYAARK
jgi:hypothetical protein